MSINRVNPANFDSDLSQDAWELRMNQIEDELGTGIEHLDEVGYTNLKAPMSADLTAVTLTSKPQSQIEEDLYEVYSVPASITMKNWKKNSKSKASRKRVLLITNSSNSAQPIVVKKPMTKRFKLHAPKKLVSPWSLVLEAGESLSYFVSFVPPPTDGADDDDFDSSIWDNFRDHIVCFTRHYPIIVPLKAIRDGVEAPEELFYPVVEALKMPPRPSFNIFDFIINGGKNKTMTCSRLVTETTNTDDPGIGEKTTKVVVNEPSSNGTVPLSMGDIKQINVKAPVIGARAQPPLDGPASNIPVRSPKPNSMSVVRVDSKMSASAVIRSMRAKNSTTQSLNRTFSSETSDAMSVASSAPLSSTISQLSMSKMGTHTTPVSIVSVEGVHAFQSNAISAAQVRNRMSTAAEDPSRNAESEELKFYRQHIREQRSIATIVNGEINPGMASSPPWRALSDSKANQFLVQPISSSKRSSGSNSRDHKSVKHMQPVSSSIKVMTKLKTSPIRDSYTTYDSSDDDEYNATIGVGSFDPSFDPSTKSFKTKSPGKAVALEATPDELDFYRNLMNSSSSKPVLSEAKIYEMIKTEVKRPASRGGARVGTARVDTFQPWLDSIGFGKYATIFQKEGLDDMKFMSSINDTDLEMLGIHGEDKHLLLREVNKFRSYSVPDPNPTRVSSSSSSDPPPGRSVSITTGNKTSVMRAIQLSRNNAFHSPEKVTSNPPTTISNTTTNTTVGYGELVDSSDDEEWIKAEYNKRLEKAKIKSAGSLSNITNNVVPATTKSNRRVKSTVVTSSPNKAKGHHGNVTIKPGQRIKVHRSSRRLKR